MSTIVITNILVKRGNAASWTSQNPILLDGEIGFERDTGNLKIGNGVDVWTALSYVSGGGGGGGGIASIIEDTTPQLGGNLDLNGNQITGMVIGVDIQAYSAILANTTASFTSAQQTKLTNLSGVNTGDQDISGIATNASNISANTSAIALNTAKNTYPSADASKVSNLPLNQNTINSDIESRVSINDAKTGITTSQSNAIIANTAKNTYPSGDASKVANLPANQNTINSNIESRTAANDAKVSYPGAQNASAVPVSPAVNLLTNVQSVLEDHESRIDGLAGGGSDGVISNVALSGTDLNFTGVGGGFNGTVDLSTIESADVIKSSNTLNVDNRLIKSDGTTRNIQITGITISDTNVITGFTSIGNATPTDLTKLNSITASATELNYTSGVTSNIQTQLNNKKRSYVNSTSNGITGTQNGTNTVFTVSQASYTPGSLLVFVSGFPICAGQGLVETTPASGIFTLDTAPESFDVIIAQYSN